MKIYFASRAKARSMKGSGKVIDCAANPSANGSRWAVEFKRK